MLASAGVALWLHEARIARVVERELSTLDAARPVTADSRNVERAIDDLHALLEVCGSSDENHGAPWKWSVGFEAALREELSWNAPFFTEVDALVADPAFERVLESGARLESTPSLMWGRTTTNLLCARAVIDARDGRSDDAARRLAQALDITRAQFGPDAISAMISSSLDAIVLDACRLVLASRHTAGGDLARELLPRVSYERARELYLQSMRGEAVFCLIPGYGSVSPEEWPERWQLRNGALDRLAALEAGMSPHVDLSVPNVHFAVADVGAQSEGRFTVAEVALRAAAYLDEHGAWPTSLADIVTPEIEERVCAAGITWSIHGDEARLIATLEPNTNYLGDWTLR